MYSDECLLRKVVSVTHSFPVGGSNLDESNSYLKWEYLLRFKNCLKEGQFSTEELYLIENFLEIEKMPKKLVGFGHANMKIGCFGYNVIIRLGGASHTHHDYKQGKIQLLLH
jgi:hypothetical protein